MKSAILKNGQVQIIDCAIPTLEGRKGAIIKVEGCGLCGSDIVKINHTSKEDEDKVVLGHEIVGEIVELNTEITGNGATAPFKKGDAVAMGHHYPCMKCKYCRHGNFSMCKTFKGSNIEPSGFSEYIYANEDHLKNTVFSQPENLTKEEFSFLEPLSCCIRAVRRAGLDLEKDNSDYNVLVMGLGSIGILMSQAAKAFGAKAYGFDINEKRQALVEKYGITFDKNIKYDIVFMTSGSFRAVQNVIDLIDLGGKIVVFSSVSNDEGYKNNDIYYKELEIIGSYSPSPHDLRLSYEFLKDKIVDVEGLSSEYKLEEINQAIEDTKSGKILKGYIKI